MHYYYYYYYYYYYLIVTLLFSLQSTEDILVTMLSQNFFTLNEDLYETMYSRMDQVMEALCNCQSEVISPTVLEVPEFSDTKGSSLSFTSSIERI